MPLVNVGDKHLSAVQQKAIDDALTVILENLSTVTKNLTDEERRRYGSVGELNKLLINKVSDFHETQAALQSPDIDWPEFDLDYVDRQFADSRLGTLHTITRMMSDFKIVHDFDNYQDSLTDYAYAQYKAGSNAAGFSEKVKGLKQFFTRTGSGGSNNTGTDRPKA